jgi:hypothetical protein
MKSSRSVFWGGALIIVGIFWLLRRLDLFSIQWDVILPYWPVLLILAGVLLIVTNKYAPARGLVGILIVLAVFGGLVSRTDRVFNRHDDDHWNFNWNDHDDHDNDDHDEDNDDGDDHDNDQDDNDGDDKDEEYENENGVKKPVNNSYQYEMEDFIQKANFYPIHPLTSLLIRQRLTLKWRMEMSGSIKAN